MTLPPPPAIDFGAIARAQLPGLLGAAPKAELHVHIEGTLEPELIFDLAGRNGVALPYPSVDALRAAYQFTDLQSFLDIYYAGASVLITEADFEAMAMAYFRRAQADGIVHAELFFDPQTHTERGVAMGTVVHGLQAACVRAERELGVGSALILCFLRHLSEDDALRTLDAARPFIGVPGSRIVGVGLDSSERGHPPEKFARAFAAARAIGLRPVAHAGEEGPPEYIVAALDVLQVERIDHGVRCTDDPALVARLARQQVPLTVCPLSNVRLCVFPTLAQHNLKALLDAGLCATVNSDDPAYFGGYLGENLRQCFQALPALDARDAWQLLANSLHASFVPPATRDAWRARLDRMFADAAAAG